MTVSVNQNHLDISRFAHALSVLLSEQTGMDITVTYRMRGGGYDGRSKHADGKKNQITSSQAS